MSIPAPIIPIGSGSLPPPGPPLGGQRSSASGGQGGAGAAGSQAPPALPGRAPAGIQAVDASNGTAAPLRPGRPLIGGGPFTLAVAFGIQAQQSQQPVTAGAAADPAQAAQIAAAQSEQGQGGSGPNQLTEEEEKVVRELQKRDQEVRRHEAAHAAVGGQYAGAPSYTYQRGPDGRQYAVGGSVSIDTSPIKGDPEATLQKARQVRAAALAPAEPSAQDRSVAAAASAMERQAQAEIAAEQRAELQGEAEGGSSEAGAPETGAEALGPSGGTDAAPSSGGAGFGAEPASQGSLIESLQGGSSSGSLPFDLFGSAPRASSGFGGRTPPQVVSITV